MSEFVIESWDGGRLLANAAFADILRGAGLTTFHAVATMELVNVVRRVKTRVTARFVLTHGGESRAFYIKRHDGYPLSELVKPLFRLTRPVLGARPEWEAMLRFHQLGIPTMTPVLFGESGRRSFVITEALEGFERADLWLGERIADAGSKSAEQCRRLTDAVARIARTMHGAHLHHQDFYLCHFLLPAGGDAEGVHVIDLGRVRGHDRLPSRWRAKDLAQLHYSAGALSCRERVRFLRAYFGRPLTRRDRGLVRRIERRRALIARHTARNGL